MATTVEELEKRVAALEQEMKVYRQLLLRQPNGETAAEAGARMLREAELAHAALAAGWQQALAQMAIHGEPIGAEQLQEMIRACGVKPEDNEFSRGIIEMREE